MGKTALVLRAMDTLAENADVDSLDSDLLQRVVIGDGQRAGREFRKFIENGARMQNVVASAAGLPAWQTVQIGKTTDEWLTLLATHGDQVNDWAKGLMSKPAFAARTESCEVELVRAEVKDLGFTDPKNLPTTTELLARAKLLGFTTDEPQAGPAARLVADSKDGFWVLHEPIADSHGDPSVFRAYRNDGEPDLSASYAGPEAQWGLEAELVLVRRKQLN